jgi:hypothetical protein
MTKKSVKSINRRAFLRGAAGVSIALPLGDFMMLGEDIVEAQTANEAKNLVTIYFPNGCDPIFWNYDIALSPLQAIRNKLILVQGLKNTVSEQHGRDQHLQGGVTLFTGKPVGSETQGTGISIDQFASKELDKFTALRQPLVSGVWRGFAGGSFRSVTWFRRSFLADGTPVEPFQNPLDIFNTIFGLNQNASDVKRERLTKSTLDLVMERYKTVTSSRYNLSSSSKRDLSFHLEKVRDIEKRAQRFQADIVQQCKASTTPPANLPPQGTFSYDMFETAYRQQMDLTILALQCGITHTASLMFGSAGEEYVNQNVSTLADHLTSHYSDDRTKEVFLSYRRYHMQNILYFLQKMDSIQQSNGMSLLDNSIVLVGSEFGESRTHTRSPQPMLLAGFGGGKLKSDQIVDLQLNHTTNDILTTVLRALGFNVSEFGETGAAHNKGIITQILT